jgi:hypothetical protein
MSDRFIAGLRCRRIRVAVGANGQRGRGVVA